MQVDVRLPVWNAVIELGAEQLKDLHRMNKCEDAVLAESKALAKLVAAEEKQGQTFSSKVKPSISSL